ncbi:hypothetical protein AC622_03180 [Bacillus sp. FJAT-27916]|uniref:recombinase family protein n=1 Tax=Bacillus sp. FJAT-27916 TaxID=1679169 RepID=UPI000670B857|nr:recombinase family protein [Bacillus sp. FJAT-27916]KMY43380.1 hypothetical protein AC622_03180 [Bacillus sp. FJAT-27916]
MPHNKGGQIRKAIGVIRRSDVKQKKNASLETQREEIYAKAKREGYTIVKVLVDDAVSAYHKTVTERPAMNLAFQMALSETEEIEAMFFYEESRISRQFFDFVEDIHKPIKKHKPHFQFFSTKKDEEWDPTKPDAIFNLASAAKESIVKSNRIKDAQKNSIDRNSRPGSELPYGYKPLINPIDNKRTPTTQVIDEKEAPIVRLIFYLASWGHSQQKIAKYLNDAGIPSPRNLNWSSATIDYILDNDQYLGHLPWNIRTHLNKHRKKKRGEYDLIANHHPAIISVQLWNLTHQTIGLHKDNGKNNDTPFLLRGILVCHRCNEKLIAKDQTTKRSKSKSLKYRCPLCRGKLDVKHIHPVVMEELAAKWNAILFNANNHIHKLLNERKKRITQHRDRLLEQLRQVEYKETLLNNHITGKNQYGVWDFALAVSKTNLTRNIYNVNQFIEYVDALLSKSSPGKNSVSDVLSMLDIDRLVGVEKRTILLSIFKEIRVDFESDNHLFVEYQMAPFAALDNYYNLIIKEANT